MPGEVTDRPNPQRVRSNVPEYVGQLPLKLDKPTLSEKTNQALAKYRRAANYIAAAMIFLQDDVYVKRDIKFEDIKPRLLGHWGTCPGLTLVYSHLNILI
jgi:xylulose-5-phosphate/fructose-6-phosphate phosphoketolase